MADYYTVEPGPAGLALRAVLALAPLALVTIVARRLGRGWLSMSLPWLLLAAALAVYAAPAMQFSETLGVNVSPAILVHLVAVAAPISLVLSLAVLAIAGAKPASTRPERV